MLNDTVNTSSQRSTVPNEPAVSPECAASFTRVRREFQLFVSLLWFSLTALTGTLLCIQQESVLKLFDSHGELFDNY